MKRSARVTGKSIRMSSFLVSRAQFYRGPRSVDPFSEKIVLGGILWGSNEVEPTIFDVEFHQLDYVVIPFCDRRHRFSIARNAVETSPAFFLALPKESLAIVKPSHVIVNIDPGVAFFFEEGDQSVRFHIRHSKRTVILATIHALENEFF